MAKDHTIHWDDNGVSRSLFIPKNTLTGYHPYAAAQHPANWSDRPDAFYPQRWLGSENFGGSVGAHAYVPFGYGIRRCLGERLALLEARVVLATLISRWEIRVEKGFEARINQHVTMGLMDGVRVHFHDL